MTGQNTRHWLMLACAGIAAIMVWQTVFSAEITQFALAILGLITGIVFKPAEKNIKYIAIIVSIPALIALARILNLLPQSANSSLIQIANNTTVFVAPAVLITALKTIRRLSKASINNK